MGLTVCNCAAFVAHLKIVMSACFKAGGISSAMMEIEYRKGWIDSRWFRWKGKR